MKIVEANSKRNLKKFIEFPYLLYKDEPNWVPPLRLDEIQLLSEKHPIWEGKKRRVFLAVQNESVHGRVMAIVQSNGIGSFGFLEVNQDCDEALKLLLKSAEDWLRNEGCNEVIGPLNPDIHNTMGLLIEGYNSKPTIMMTYNREDVPSMISKLGYSVDRVFSSYDLTPDKFVDYGKLQRVRNWLEQRHNVSVRNPDMSDFDGELKTFHMIYNSAFEQHYGNSDLGWETFKAMGKGMKLIIEPRLVFIIEKDSNPVGFLLALPDYNEVFSKLNNGRLLPFGWIKFLKNRKRIEKVRIMTMAILPEFQHLGLGSLVYSLMSQSIDKCGYKYAELGWVDDVNTKMVKACMQMGGVVSKKYAIFRKNLS